MSDISKIKVSGVLYDIKDSQAREDLNSKIEETKSQLSESIVEISDGKNIKRKVNITWSDGWIDGNGRINSSSLSMYSQPFELLEGEVLEVSTLNTRICLIATTDKNVLNVGDYVTPYRVTPSSGRDTYSYNAIVSSKVVVCVLKSDYTLSIDSFTTNGGTDKIYDNVFVSKNGGNEKLFFYQGGYAGTPYRLAYRTDRVSTQMILAKSKKIAVTNTLSSVFLVGVTTKNSENGASQHDYVWYGHGRHIINLDYNDRFIAVALKKVDGSVVSPKEIAGNLTLAFLDDDSVLERNNDSFRALEQAMKTQVSAAVPCVSLIHFSDIHGDIIRAQRIATFAENMVSKVDDTVCTGDIAFQRSTEFTDTWGADSRFASMLVTVGNHDAVTANGTVYTPYSKEQAISLEDRYKLMFAPYISHWGGVSIQTNKTWWYKDYATKKLRLIGLDSVVSDDDGYAEQANWLNSVLSDAITKGYAIAIAIHYPPLGEKVDCNFSTSSKNAPSGEGEIPIVFVSEVDNFITNGGKFMCWICGHIHFDQVIEVGNKQIAVSISCASLSQGKTERNVTNRTIGEKSEDCFNVVVLDSNTQLTKFIRFGVDRDCNMTHKGTMCVDGKTGTVVYSD